MAAPSLRVIRVAHGMAPAALPLVTGMSLLLVSETASRAHAHTLASIMQVRHAATVTRVVGSLPTARAIDEIAASIDLSAVTSVIAFGGGSTIDTAKVVATLETGRSLSAAVASEDALVATRRRELVAIPTTAGSGAEVTPFAAIWTRSEQNKISIERNDLAPDLVILVPDVLATCPTSQVRSSLLDAIGHCADSIWNRRSDHASESLARRGLRIGVDSLGAVNSQPPHRLAHDLQEISLLGGMVITQTRTSIAHALSYYLTNRHGLPHGDAVAIFLPAITRFLIRHTDRFGADELLVEMADAITRANLLELHNDSLRKVESDAVVRSAIASPRLKNFMCDVSAIDVAEIVADTLDSTRA